MVPSELGIYFFLASISPFHLRKKITIILLLDVTYNNTKMCVFYQQTHSKQFANKGALGMNMCPKVSE